MRRQAGPMTVALLGPQRRRPNVRHALDRLGVEGEVALVSAGWQEREGETADLEEHLGRRVIDLALYRRAERVWADDPELARVLRARQAALQELQAVYRIRLRHALAAWREVAHSTVGSRVRDAGARAALRTVRRLDREHLRALARLNERIDRQIGATGPALARQGDDLEARLEPAAAVLIAGGHVAVLLNRLRLFGAASWLARRPVVAWSAGAMTLTERVVLFHDRPPQGPGDPEVLDAGLGLVGGIVALPDAAHRLDLADRERVGALAARFAPARCRTLDDGALMTADPPHAMTDTVRELDRRGAVLEVPPA